MRKEVFVSSPGRLSFLGEHAWLLGEGIVLALDNLRTYVAIKNANKPGITSISMNFNERIHFSSEMMKNYSNHWADYVKACIKILRENFHIGIDNIEIEILSVLPISAGLSSSSALTTAIIGGLGEYYNLNLTVKKIANLAYLAEHDELHIQGSQIDQYVCALGGMLYVNTKNVSVEMIEKFTPDENLLIVIGDTKIPKNTKKIINALKERVRKKDPSIFEYIKLNKNLIGKARVYFKEKPWNIKYVGNWMNDTHSSLKNKLKISNHLLDLLCKSSLLQGAYGARMTGAGKGGCMFALCSKEIVKKVQKKIISLGATAYIALPSEKGFRTETGKDYQKLKHSLVK